MYGTYCGCTSWYASPHATIPMRACRLPPACLWRGGVAWPLVRHGAVGGYGRCASRSAEQRFGVPSTIKPVGCEELSYSVNVALIRFDFMFVKTKPN
jgi:hypothetical protein